MKAKLIINDQELEVEISEEEYKKLQPAEEKNTGYERVKENDRYYYANYRGEVENTRDERCTWDDDPYNVANYYSSKEVAENNTRADKLMRQLRRFAVEHRENEICWSDNDQAKYAIGYEHELNRLETYLYYSSHNFGQIYFNTEKAAQLAIDTFHDELIWYFTEYKDSL